MSPALGRSDERPAVLQIADDAKLRRLPWTWSFSAIRITISISIQDTDFDPSRAAARGTFTDGGFQTD